MATIVVTDSGGLDFTDGLAALRSAGHRAVLLETGDPDAVAEAAADCAALIVSFTPIGRSVLDRLPQLRVIATTTVGSDTVDLAAAAERGIQVRTLPSIASEEVAVHALAGLLSLVRELPAAQREACSGCWDYSAIATPPRLSELTLGLLGFGRIARHLATIARPLVRGIVAHDPFVAHWPDDVERVDRDAVFARADIVSLHAPATADTTGLVNRQLLATMRPGSYLVNVARALVVEPDLLAALDTGRLRGAFLDVTDPEPPAADSPLRSHPRVQLSPHSAFASTATLRDYAMIPVRHVLDVLGTPASDHVVAD